MTQPVTPEMIEALKEWAFEKSSLHHRLAHENEALRTEHIASSSAYREMAETGIDAALLAAQQVGDKGGGE